MKKILCYVLIVLSVFALIPTSVLAEPSQSPPTQSTVPPSESTTPTPTPTPTPSTAPPISAPDVSVSVSPGELTAAGNVTLTVSIRNTNSVTLNSVAITADGSTLRSGISIGASDTYTYSEQYAVSASKLGAPVSLVVTYSDGFTAQSVSKSFTVNQKAATISVNTVVKVDKNAVAANEKVNFSFAIENNSNVAIENVRLKASALNGGNTIGQVASIAAGDAKLINYSVNVAETMTVTPVLTYTAAGKSYNKTLDSIIITVSDASMEIVASAGQTMPGEETTFSITLKNTGNVSFTDIELFDQDDNPVSLTSTSLAGGSTISATHSMLIEENAFVDFYAIAKDANGNSYTFRSNEVEVIVTEKDEVDYATLFTLTAEADKLELGKKGGEVVFSLTIDNQTDQPFTNLLLYEETLGEIESYSSFPSGEKTITYAAQITKAGTYTFVLSALTPEGTPIIVQAEPIVIEVQDAAGSTASTLLWILIVVIVLIVGAGVTLLVLVLREKKKTAAEGGADPLAKDKASKRPMKGDRPARRSPVVSDGRIRRTQKYNFSDAEPFEKPAPPARAQNARKDSNMPEKEQLLNHKVEPLEDIVEEDAFTEEPIKERSIFEEPARKFEQMRIEETPEENPVVPAHNREDVEKEELDVQLLKRPHRDFKDRNDF